MTTQILPRRGSGKPPATQAGFAYDPPRVDRRAALADESLQVVHGVADWHADPLRTEVERQERLDGPVIFHDGDPGIRPVPVHRLGERQGEKRILQLRRRLLEESP